MHKDRKGGGVRDLSLKLMPLCTPSFDPQYWKPEIGCVWGGGGGGGGTRVGILGLEKGMALEFDRATWSFLKFDRRH